MDDRLVGCVIHGRINVTGKDYTNEYTDLVVYGKETKPNWNKSQDKNIYQIKAGLYRIWCGGHTLGDSGVHTLGDTSAFVNPAGQLLLTPRVNSRMDGVGKVFEFYIPVFK